MKAWTPIIILTIAVISLCAWDSIHINQVFNKMQDESNYVYTALVENKTIDENLKYKVKDINDYWTHECNTLCLSISKKDLQPVADYLQYLQASMINENVEDAITYAQLLTYNVQGLGEANGINIINLL